MDHEELIYEIARKAYELITQIKEAATDSGQSDDVREFAVGLLDSMGAIIGAGEAAPCDH